MTLFKNGSSDFVVVIVVVCLSLALLERFTGLDLFDGLLLLLLLLGGLGVWFLAVGAPSSVARFGWTRFPVILESNPILPS